jgi:hypothetical protein
VEQTTKQKIIDFKKTFSTEEGKRVLEILGKVCLAKADMFVPESDRMTSYNLGANWVYRFIVSQIEYDLEKKTQDFTITERTQDGR